MLRAPFALLSRATRATRTTAAGLVLANLMPLLGIVALGWSPFSVVMVYVVETVIVGLYTWLRMLLAQKTPSGQRIALAMFFTMHYGLFVLVQTVFIVMALGVADLWSPDNQRELMIAGAGFVVSHGFSFVVHYLRGGEFREADARLELVRPYGRIFAQQFVAVFGFWIAMSFGEARIGPVVILVICKLMIDLGSHLHAHATGARDRRASTTLDVEPAMPLGRPRSRRTRGGRA